MKKHTAFTLVEILISTALLAILMVAIGSALGVAGRTVAGNDRLIRARYATQHTLDYLLQRVRESPLIQLQDAGGLELTSATQASRLYVAETIDPATLVVTHWKVFDFSTGRFTISSDGGTAVDVLPAKWSEQSVIFKSPATSPRSTVTIDIGLSSPDMTGDLSNEATLSMSGSAISRAVQ